MLITVKGFSKRTNKKKDTKNENKNRKMKEILILLRINILQYSFKDKIKSTRKMRGRN